MSTNACGLQTKIVHMESGTGERRWLAHFVGEDQDPSFWCSAPFDWFKRKLEKTKIDLSCSESVVPSTAVIFFFDANEWLLVIFK